MKILERFLLALVGGLALTVAVHAQDQSGFISIDCGLSTFFGYKDEHTGIMYSPDAAFIDTGINLEISSEYKDGQERQLLTVRSFPKDEGLRNCYNLSSVQVKGSKYLIRASFMYGNYDGLDRLPEFDLHLGVELWDTVRLDNPEDIVSLEIIHTPSSIYIYVCLVNTGFGTPFISTLEIRPLNRSLYPESRSLVNFLRFNFADAKTVGYVRYPNDVYDRGWPPINEPTIWSLLNTSLSIDVKSHSRYQPASSVMRTAVMAEHARKSLDFYWTLPTIAHAYVYMHFAEIKELQANQIREFNITINGKFYFGPVSPLYLEAVSVFSLVNSTSSFSFSLIGTENSNLPPMINAIEIYYPKQFLLSQTDEYDAYAIVNVKSTYGVNRNWQGDPCVAKAYLWEGLNCSYNGNNAPRIIFLDLSSSRLTGEISYYLSNLTAIQYLDFSNNSLTGPVPNFLCLLTFLKYLNIEGNNLSGSVPEELIERSKNGSLLLRTDKAQIPTVCELAPCMKEKKKIMFVIPVIALLTAVAVLGAGTLTWREHRRAARVSSSVAKVDYGLDEEDRILVSKSLRFTYSEILVITKNLERVVGKGGFGNVYYGYLNGIPVAVKMLSQSSMQGYKQFQAEAELMARLRHENLTSLVGYCHQSTNMGLIYEYMAKGNLGEHLSDANRNVLSWVIRLQIAVDAGQGLDYLHNGCTPRIIHRDVKSTNILLNENFRAKLSDFGLSRVLPSEDVGYVSTAVVGTFGYLDPEYFRSSKLTEKSDVYSFGIVLLELITGQPAVSDAEDKTHIVQWVSPMLATEEGDVQKIIDPRLEGDFEIKTVQKVVDVAVACTSSVSIKRPTMTDVVMELKECLAAEEARLDSKVSIQSLELGGECRYHVICRESATTAP